ncbi:MAG: LysM peptidoglycan-binding domain-containing protein [Clostridia bacterium]|nr:LysM peptidoglycan-binding domain-containing protein [Clostridia bacterium]
MREYIEHTIARGETLTSIARRYGTTVQELVRLNRITNPDLIYAGETIRVPASSGTRSYTIRRGDTLSGIAQQYGTTVNELIRLNDISNPDLIYAGDTILIPASGSSTYTVRRGDTLWAIARRFGTTVNRLARLNGIVNPARLSIGQVLLIP